MARIHQLQASNFKRIQALTIDFPEGGGMLEVCGRNGQGKSSAIDAIWAALGGTKASPEQPIRNGSLKGSVSLDLGEFTVLREWDAKGTRLTVTDKSGSKMGRPQELLDGLFDRMTFDPMEFTRQTSSKQAEMLRKITGLDFSKMEEARATLYQERTDVNRAIKAQEAKFADMPEVDEVLEVSAEELNSQLKAASKANAEVARVRQGIERIVDDIDETKEKIRSLEEKLSNAKGRLKSLQEDHVQRTAALGQEVDTAPILEAITLIEQTNRKARQWRERVAAGESLQANRDHAQSLTEKIEDIDLERNAILANAKFPVAGLSLHGEVVTFGGIPFSQIATSEQIRVSLAMSAALNKKLRLMRVKDGSLLDDASLRLVAEWAEQNEYQVIVERVADSAKGTGVVIEEGRIKAKAGTEVQADTELASV